DPVHDVQRASYAANLITDPVAHPKSKSGCLLGEPKTEQRVYREGCISNPGVPIVPVTFAAYLLGQRRRRCRDNATARRVRHELQRDRGPLERFAPPSGIGALREPGPPKPNGLVEEIPNLATPAYSRGGRVTGLTPSPARR